MGGEPVINRRVSFVCVNEERQIVADGISKSADLFEGLVSKGTNNPPLCPGIERSCSVRPLTTLPPPVSVGHGNGVWPPSSTILGWVSFHYDRIPRIFSCPFGAAHGTGVRLSYPQSRDLHRSVPIASCSHLTPIPGSS